MAVNAGTAGTAVCTALRAEVDRLRAAEPEVRADAYDSVHQMRVSTRRLRSLLRSYRALFDRAPADALRTELQWLAGELGIARDAEVRADRFAALLAELPDVPAEVTATLVDGARAEYRAAHAAVLHTFESARYAELSAELTHWRSHPPVTSRGERPAAKTFHRIVQRDHDRLSGLVTAPTPAAPEAATERLHDIRKSAKRLRYCCETATPVIGDSTAALGKQAKTLQTVLGEHRDAIEAAAALERYAAASAHPEIYRRLAEQESRAAEAAIARYPAARAFLMG